MDYSTVQVTLDPQPDDFEVEWTYSGNKGTFWIPDETKATITYRAKVVGDPGQRVTYSNTAKMLGYSDGTKETVTLSGSGSGSGTNYQIRVYKYEDNTMNVPLEGAVFQLYVEDPDAEDGRRAVTYGKDSASHAAGAPVYITTGADGYATLRLSSNVDGVYLQKGVNYYLYERHVPDGHTAEDIYWHFRIGDKDDFNDETHEYQYHNNGIVKISNESTDKGLILKKSFEGSSLTDAQKEKIAFRIVGRNAEGETVYSRTVNYGDFKGGRFRIKPGQLKPGVTYTITETNADVNGYARTTTVVVDEGGEITAEEGSVTFTQGELDANATHTVAFTNRYQPHSYTFTKVDGETSAPLPGAEFTVYEYRRGSGLFASYSFVDTGKKLVSDESGHFTLRKDVFTDFTFKENTAYYIVETKAPNGYAKNETQYKFWFYTGSGSTTAPSGFANEAMNLYAQDASATVVDDVQVDGVVIKKVDANTRALLPGAEFALQKYVWVSTSWFTGRYDWVNVPGELQTGAGGTVYLEDIAKDRLYRLIETKAPDGYEEPSGDEYIYFYWYSDEKPLERRWPDWYDAPDDLAYGDVTFIDGSGGTISVENAPKPGGLTVRKAVPAGEDASREIFTFEVTLTNGDGTPLTGAVKVQDRERAAEADVPIGEGGKLTVSVSGAGDAVLSGLPAGTRYAVREINIPEGWQQDGAPAVAGGNADGAIDPDERETVTVTNKRKGSEGTSFSFGKIWLGPNGSLDRPGDFQPWQQPISVTLGRRVGEAVDADFALTYAIDGGSGTYAPLVGEGQSRIPEEEGSLGDAETRTRLTLTASDEGNVFTFALPVDALRADNAAGAAWEYYVREARLDGYAPARYGAATPELAVIQGAVDAKDGGVIVNQTYDGCSLPSTGGAGTRAFSLLGGAMVLLALAGLILVQSRKRRGRRAGSQQDALAPPCS